MNISYQPVLWNRQKLWYDTILILSVVSYLVAYILVGGWLDPNITLISLRMRALGSASFILLHFILSIGPLSRLDTRFLPLLYNRRHAGVVLCILGCIHAYYVVIEYHKWGKLEPYINLFLGNLDYIAFTQFPFQVLGLMALLIFIIMALTSHDFWLKNLTPLIFKKIHMFIYLAYALIVLHVLLGPLQFETSYILIGLTFIGMVWILGLHLLVARKEHQVDSSVLSCTNLSQDGYIPVCQESELREDMVKMITLNDERIALMRYQNKIYAVSNVCPHQNGPLGEGKIIDGCITCPWHGYQFDVQTGLAPAPYDDQIPIFDVKIIDTVVYIKPDARFIVKL